MSTLKIDKPTVFEGFNSDETQQQNRMAIARQVDAYHNGTSRLLTKEESRVIINAFIKNISKKNIL